jgi:hypothetical protein
VGLQDTSPLVKWPEKRDGDSGGRRKTAAGIDDHEP